MKLHIFNPENDMALASGSPGYTPPANIRQYRRENCFLPRLWASPGDIVWDGEEDLSALFRDEATVPEICPWGWSPAIVHELTLAGVPQRFLPTREWLSRLRILSGRESTVPVQQHWGVDVQACHDISQVEACIEKWGRVMMKSPWSSSGKGLMQVDNPNWRGWVLRILRLQGAVVVERLLERSQDFAMEFRLSDGKAEYLGMNVFRTDAHGHFLENVSVDEFREIGDVACPSAALLPSPSVLSDIRDWYLEHLPAMAPWYEGPVGVDMMTLADGTLQPCVEINWRMTMGMVAVLTRKPVP